MRIDITDVCKFGVVEPPRNLEAREIGHASRTETGNELGRYFLASEALARDGGLDQSDDFFLAETGEAPSLDVFLYVFVCGFDGEADVEDDAKIDYSGIETLRLAVVGQSILEGVP